MSENVQVAIAGIYLIIWCMVKFVCSVHEDFSFRAILDILAIFIAIGFVSGMLKYYKD